jgi:hypothetical protein
VRGGAPSGQWWSHAGVLVLAAVVGCRGRAPAPSAPPGAGRTDAGAVTVSKDALLAPPPSQSTIDDPAQARLIDRTLCRQAGCCVVWIQDAGTDRKGRTLLVARTAPDGTDCLIPRPAAGPGKAKDASEESDDRCRTINHHLVVLDKEKVRGRYTLSSECEHGGPINYHRIEDQIEVDSKAHTFEHFHSNMKGQSNWGSGVIIGLDPVRVIEWSQFGDRPLEINWDLLRHRVTWTAPDEEALAQSQATPPPDPGEAEQEEGEDEGPTVERSSISVPMLELPARFTAGGWKTTGLGGCGVLIDGGDNGYTLHGKADGADASLRVVASTDGVLFVEVTDDRWTGPSRSWVKDDHLELWLAREAPAGAAGKAKASAVQWGIRIADGATFPAFGAPEPLRGVEAVRRGSVARVKIPFAPAAEDARFALVYSDGDDGKTQERLIATAPLERGDGGTLGGAWTVNPDDASCALRGGALAVVRPPPKDSPIGGDLETYRQ